MTRKPGPLIKTSGHSWQKLRAKVIARDLGQCVVCGSTEELQVDHIIERRNGGGDEMNNLRVRIYGRLRRLRMGGGGPMSIPAQFPGEFPAPLQDSPAELLARWVDHLRAGNCHARKSAASRLGRRKASVPHFW